jgi:formylmethanofuran dehydrogenase subunit E
MSAKEILASEDWQKCIDFHGHTCPGVAIGYRAAKAGLKALREQKAADEELVTILETDACGADAIQVLTGCTFGKGNFIFKDYGKHAFTFFSRNSGKGVRVVMRHGVLGGDDRHQVLIDKIREGRADEKDRREFEKLHVQKTHEVLDKPVDGLFSIQDVEVPLPEKARMMASELCGRCGEPVMASKLSEVDGRRICRGCLES